MPNLKSKIAVKAGEYVGRSAMKKISDFTNELETWTSKNPLNAKTANPPDEDEYMREYNKKKKQVSIPSDKQGRMKLKPMQREVSTWSKEDLDSVMQSKDYQYDELTQKKVKRYFERKYPETQKLDATGRPY